MDSSPGGPFRRGLIVANPAAGSVTTGLVDDVLSRCRHHLPEVRVQWTTANGGTTTGVRAAIEAVPAERPDVVLAVGGDGTVREVVAALVGVPAPQRPALLVVPGGTGNSNYLAHWGTRPWPEALGLALSGAARLRRIDLAHLRERDELVLLGACSGIVAEALLIARDVPLTGRARLQEAFVRSTRSAVPYAGRVTVDGRVVHKGGTLLANVGGGRHRGGTYRLLPHSKLDDGLLDVCVIGDGMAAHQVPDLIRHGDHVGRPGVVYASGRRITVERTDGEPLWFEHDGELLDRSWTSFTLEVLAGVLPVLCDPAVAEG